MSQCFKPETIQFRKLTQFDCPPALTLGMFRRNKFEFDQLNDYLTQQQKTTLDIWNHSLSKVNSGAFQVKRTRAYERNIFPEKTVTLNRDSCVCSNCFGKIWFFMLLEYHSQVKSSFAQRSDCWWGVNCTTMNHRYEHARRLNHMAPQVKFN